MYAKRFVAAFAAGCVSFLIAGTASAASVVCGNATLGTRTVTIDPALTGGLCYAQEGNLQDVDIAGLGFVTVDKDTTDDFPTGDPSESALWFTRSDDTSGTWTLSSSALWDAYSTLYIAFHFGGGGDQPDRNPDSFVVQLARADLTGTYALGGGKLNGLSNIYLLGVRCTEPDGCGTDEFNVPEPGTLALLGLVAAAAGFSLRRRAG